MKREETIERLKKIKGRIGWEDYKKDCEAIDKALSILENELEEAKEEDSLSERQKNVLDFIDNFLNYQGEDNAEVFRHQFRAGYCLHFAEMLKAIFKRGTVCWCSGLGHIVWVDTDNTPYDIEGINESECDYYIPIAFIESGLDDFRHIPRKGFNASEKYIKAAIKKYEMDIQPTKRVNPKVMTIDLIYGYMYETGRSEIEISYLIEMIKFIFKKTKNNKFNFELEFEENREEIFDLIKFNSLFYRDQEKIKSEYCITEKRVPNEIMELIQEFIKLKKIISFKDIKEPNIAIHSKSKKELCELINHLDKLGYKYGTRGSSIKELEDYCLSCFCENTYLSLDIEESSGKKFVATGIGWNDKIYEFSEIKFD